MYFKIEQWLFDTVNLLLLPAYTLENYYFIIAFYLYLFFMS